ncbi:hypothetical protein B0H17DRAFT_1134148 [Mycena rosella]|uniref:Uncharacterized protein n=1 Tax=Mycena rosella TaxID=1033263 RepID=A0AAD7GEA7_MYCRO|nr:hypothetical protein B0H17DRAFT_1134148 [Mycena rosella]
MSIADTPPPPPVFDWGPRITFPLPPSRHPLPLTPVPWGDLQFTPSGAYNLRRRLSASTDEVGRFNRSRYKFMESDLAHLEAGASIDGAHMISPDKFFQEFHDLYKALPTGAPGQAARKLWDNRIRQLVFDLCTKWDHDGHARCGYDSTWGAGRSGTPQGARIPTAESWRRRGLKIWSLSQVGQVSSVSLPTHLIPLPTSVNAAQTVLQLENQLSASRALTPLRLRLARLHMSAAKGHLGFYSDAIRLLLRFVSPFNWGGELACLQGFPEEMGDGLLEAMDEDRRAGQ